MSERPPRPSRPSKAATHKAAASARSGQHPAVIDYRKKLESIVDGAGAAADKLDQDLKEFLSDLESRPPLPPPDRISTDRVSAEHVPPSSR